VRSICLTNVRPRVEASVLPPHTPKTMLFIVLSKFTNKNYFE
jgi:hypothetical protein